MRSRGESSGVVPPPPSSIGADTAEASSTADANVPLPTTSDDSNIRRMLDHVLIVQAAQGQILVTFWMRLEADLARFRSSSSPPPF